MVQSENLNACAIGRRWTFDICFTTQFPECNGELFIFYFTEADREFNGMKCDRHQCLGRTHKLALVESEFYDPMMMKNIFTLYGARSLSRTL